MSLLRASQNSTSKLHRPDMRHRADARHRADTRHCADTCHSADACHRADARRLLPQVRLISDLFAVLIPGLSKDYPHAPMRIRVAATSQPNLDFRAGSGGALEATFQTEVFVQAPAPVSTALTSTAGLPAAVELAAPSYVKVRSRRLYRTGSYLSATIGADLWRQLLRSSCCCVCCRILQEACRSECAATVYSPGAVLHCG